MKRGVGFCALCVLCCCGLFSCLTANAKKIIEPPYRPPVVENAYDAGEVEKLAYVYYSDTDIPAIDGNFTEWRGLPGVHTRQMVYGGLFNPENTDGLFVLRTDGKKLYLYADILDDDPGVNTFPVPQAWRGDSIEFFFGTDTSSHSFYKNTDKRVRIAPTSKTNKFGYVVGINDVATESSEIQVAVVFNDTGYQIEAALPFSLMNIKGLKVGQKIRADFQINDADGGKERSRLIHWNSPKDNTYLDAGSWGDGEVVALPEVRLEEEVAPAAETAPAPTSADNDISPDSAAENSATVSAPAAEEVSE